MYVFLFVVVILLSYFSVNNFSQNQTATVRGRGARSGMSRDADYESLQQVCY